MEISKIKSGKQMEQYCEGLVNDIKGGIMTNGEAMHSLYEYTMHLLTMGKNKVDKLKKILAENDIEVIGEDSLSSFKIK